MCARVCACVRVHALLIALHVFHSCSADGSETSHNTHTLCIPSVHYSHTSNPSTHMHTAQTRQAVFHQIKILHPTPPLPPSTVFTMWQWRFVGTLDKHPELDAGFFLTRFHLLLVPKESNNAVMSFNEPSDPLKGRWQILPKLCQ